MPKEVRRTGGSESRRQRPRIYRFPDRRGVVIGLTFTVIFCRSSSLRDSTAFRQKQSNVFFSDDFRGARQSSSSACLRQTGRALTPPRDRKSTRLNSSHLG